MLKLAYTNSNKTSMKEEPLPMTTRFFIFECIKGLNGSNEGGICYKLYPKKIEIRLKLYPEVGIKTQP